MGKYIYPIFFARHVPGFIVFFQISKNLIEFCPFFNTTFNIIFICILSKGALDKLYDGSFQFYLILNFAFSEIIRKKGNVSSAPKLDQIERILSGSSFKYSLNSGPCLYMVILPTHCGYFQEY